jgi:hypothetical protein
MKPSSVSLIKASVLSASLLAGVAAAPGVASAQEWYGGYGGYGYGANHLVTRCDRDGDRCATYRCDPGGDACDRVSGWRSVDRGYYRGNGYGSYGYGSYGYGRTITRCDSDGDRCATYRCDSDGDRCSRTSGWWSR